MAGKFNINIEQVKKSLYQQGVKDREWLLGEKKKKEAYKYINKDFLERIRQLASDIDDPKIRSTRVRIFVDDIDISFSARVPNRQLNEEDLVNIFKEFVAMLEAPTEEDKELF